MTTYRKVLVNDGDQAEALAYETFKPGFLLNKRSDGKLIKHATAAATFVVVRVALENTETGLDINTAYAAGDTAKYFIPEPGMVLAMWLKDGENVALTDKLESAGDGTLQKLTTGAVVGVPAIAFNNTTGAAALMLVEIPGNGGASSLTVPQTTFAALTDSSGGTADDTVAAIGTIALSTAGGNTYTDAAVNTAVNAKLAIIANDFADVAAKINAIRTALRSAGIVA